MQKGQERSSKDYVFKEHENGRLVFVGDFESFYKNESDPWEQSGTRYKLRGYYGFSRSNLVNTIKSLEKYYIKRKKINILEAGCGLGYVSLYLQTRLSSNIDITGMDISSIAIKKAKVLFPSIEFIVGDICSEDLHVRKKYDIVIISQMLWYILEGFPQVFANVNLLLNKEGFLIFTQGFLKEQRYGTDIVNGFDGLVKYVITKYFEKYKIIKAEIDYSGKFIFDDGILVLKKMANFSQAEIEKQGQDDC